MEMARDICLEQTVEFPADLVPVGSLREQIIGRIEAFEPLGSGSWQATISYASETAGFELTQLLNVVFGNYSLKPGARVERLELPTSLRRALAGPRFGRDGLRSYLGVPRRPLLCTAIKPMGLSVETLADLAYRLALGGIDLIKDDHGLANQPFAPFRERVARCSDAVARASRETGRRSLYLPNVTADGEVTIENARYAKAAGAGGLLVAPGLTGWGMLARLAREESIALPILSHPSFLGCFVASPVSGIAPGALFGQIARFAGADGSIYPNFGGRFSFSREDCRAIAAATSIAMAPIKPCFPVPAGGLTLEGIPELLDFYGREVIFLIGGGLHQRGPDLLIESCRLFRHLVEAS